MNFIKNAIEKAEIENSDLNKSLWARGILDLSGETSKKLQHLLYNLLDWKEKIHVLELGVYRGKSLVAMGVHPNTESVTGIDNFSYSAGSPIKADGWTNVEEALAERLKYYEVKDKATIIKSDLSVLDTKQLKVYDFIHLDINENSTVLKDTLDQLLPTFNTQFILVISNYRESHIRILTEVWMSKHKLRKIDDKELISHSSSDDRNWMNGVRVLFLQKAK